MSKTCRLHLMNNAEVLKNSVHISKVCMMILSLFVCPYDDMNKDTDEAWMRSAVSKIVRRKCMGVIWTRTAGTAYHTLIRHR